MKFLLVLSLVVVLTTAGMTYKRWEGNAPQVTFDRDFKALGRTPSLNMVVEDAGTGLSHVTIRLSGKDQDVVLLDEALNKEASKSYDVGKLLTEKYKIQDGPAVLSVSASDDALRNFGRGNLTNVTKEFTFHTMPPKLEVLQGQHYINQGGSECVVYRVSDNAVASGVQVGSHFFPGFPVSGSDKNLRFALFALKYDWPADTPIKVVARDAAGNESTGEFWRKVFPKKFRSRDIALDDSFIKK